MPIIAFQEINKDKIEFQLIERYRASIDELRSLQFTDLYGVRELWFPFSLLLMFPIYWILRAKGELVFITTPFRVGCFSPVLMNHEYGTYTDISSLGVKFYTNFSDGTLLVSANYIYDNRIPSEDVDSYHRRNRQQSISPAWEAHSNWVEESLAGGLELIGNLSSEDYEATVLREGKARLRWMPNSGKTKR